MKKQLSVMIESGENIMRVVKETIINLTKDNPLVLFTMNEDNDPVVNGEPVTVDDLLDFPWCDYMEDTYYCMATVQKVEGDSVTVFLQDEEYDTDPNFETLPLSSLDFQQQIEVLKLLNNR